MHTTIVGQGEPVLVLHSGGMSSRQWRKLGERLSRHWRVIMPDFLGSGGNPPWPDDERFHFEQDLQAVDALVDGPFHLVGHSYGGFLALLLALRRTDRVRSIAVYDPVSFGVLYDVQDPEGLADLARVAAHSVFTDDAVGGQEPWMEAFIDYWNGPGTWRAMPAASRDSFLRVGRKVYYEVMTLSSDRTGCAAYGAIAAPVLLLCGEKSPRAARRVVQLLAGALPHATLKEVAGAGHMGPISHTDDVNALIEAHLQGVG